MRVLAEYLARMFRLDATEKRRGLLLLLSESQSPTPAQRKAFLAWGTAAGYSTEELPKSLDGSAEYGLRLSHVASPKFDSISTHTLELLKEARAHGGDYDGWETYVVKATDPKEDLTH